MGREKGFGRVNLGALEGVMKGEAKVRMVGARPDEKRAGAFAWATEVYDTGAPARRRRCQAAHDIVDEASGEVGGVRVRFELHLLKSEGQRVAKGEQVILRRAEQRLLGGGRRNHARQDQRRQKPSPGCAHVRLHSVPKRTAAVRVGNGARHVMRIRSTGPKDKRWGPVVNRSPSPALQLSIPITSPE